MALPNKDSYIPVKMIYVLQSPIKHDEAGKPVDGWYMQGVQFNSDGKGTTTSYRDMRFLVDKAGCKNITAAHWKAKEKEWNDLVEKKEKGPKPVVTHRHAVKTKKG